MIRYYKLEAKRGGQAMLMTRGQFAERVAQAENRVSVRSLAIRLYRAGNTTAQIEDKYPELFNLTPEGRLKLTPAASRTYIIEAKGS